MTILLTSCASEKTALQEAIGANSRQAKVIEKILVRNHIDYELIRFSEHPVTVGMDTNWQAYDLINYDGKTNVLILRKSDQEFALILDNEGKIIEGIVDDQLLPAFFENNI